MGSSCTKNDSGRYVVALWAEDFAGNSSYFATILLEINPDIIGFRFKVIDYNLQLSKKRFVTLWKVLVLKGYGDLTMKLHSLDMILGERRQITLELIPRNNDGIIISSANYLLVYGDIVESSGVPIIDGLELTVTVEPKKKALTF